MLNPSQVQQLRKKPADPNRLQAAMQITGETQVAVAEGTGLQQAHISKIATKGVGVSLRTAAKLAAFFGCEMSDLFPQEMRVEVRHFTVEVRHAS